MGSRPPNESNARTATLSQVNRLDRICDLYERELQAGSRPRLEDFLILALAAEQAGLQRDLEAISSDYEMQRRQLADTPGITVSTGRKCLCESCQGDGPRRIGRYQIEKVLGRGGFGEVYLAYDEQLDRHVALKAPHTKLTSRPEGARAYLAEARMVANLDHPHIVPVYDVGCDEDCPCYIVSKYVEGTDLATKLKRHRFTYAEAAELAATVAEALDYAHGQGLVHRDVKPGNILIGNDGQPYVVDFGLALKGDNIGEGPRYLGTPAYMSPEQAHGEGHQVDARSDIFSLGVVLFELLVGERPFPGETQAELLQQLMICDPPPLGRHGEKPTRELERICHKALAKLASDRYATAGEMASDLRQFLAAQTVSGGGSETASVAHAVAREPASGVIASAAPPLGAGAASQHRDAPVGADGHSAHGRSGHAGGRDG